MMFIGLGINFLLRVFFLCSFFSGFPSAPVTACRGHGFRRYANGFSFYAPGILSAEVQNVVNDHVDSGAPTTTPSLREALRRADLEFSCNSGQLHNLVVFQLRPSWLR